ncbi:hypothetical protein CK203_064752 [Vitis vinifera]|uniref:Uncharacterized protein n=1 Tax=Vitis vinifera TaxID=29760 RepID=A0A438G422_VITVI|nr:hypothetical protein CK203_064752 [Vitis vinifera]
MARDHSAWLGNSSMHSDFDLLSGVVHLGQLSVTTNPLLAHTTHTVPPPTDSMHSINFVELDDHIHMLSWDESDLEPIVSDKIYEIGRVILGLGYVDEVQTPYVNVSQTPYVDDAHTSDVQYVIRGGRVVQQQPPTAARPLEGTSSHEEVRKEDDDILRQLQSTQARISIYSLLASSSTHRDALIQALS